MRSTPGSRHLAAELSVSKRGLLACVVYRYWLHGRLVAAVGTAGAVFLCLAQSCSLPVVF